MRFFDSLFKFMCYQVKRSGCRYAAMTASVVRLSSSTHSSLNVCRICQTHLSRERLISPCHCKGTLGLVHLSCLERWLNACNRDYCEICRYHFQSKRIKKYSFCQSIRVWARQPRHRAMLRSDLLVASVLTIITLGLCSISTMGMQYFVLEGSKLGVSSFWTHGIIVFLLGVIVVGYSSTVYLMMRDHVVPWYRWWNRTMVIRLILTTSAEEVVESRDRMRTASLQVVPQPVSAALSSTPSAPLIAIADSLPVAETSASLPAMHV